MLMFNALICALTRVVLEAARLAPDATPFDTAFDMAGRRGCDEAPDRDSVQRADRPFPAPLRPFVR